MRYLLGTGYHDHGGGMMYQKEAWLWIENTRRWTQPAHTVVIAQSGSVWPCADAGTQILTLTGDLGYCPDLTAGIKANHFNGGEGAILALAMIAYVAECDLLFQEQDCLAFGPYPERMYQDLGDGGIVHGGPLKRHAGFIGFSLFLLRHSFIPKFVNYYSGTEPGRSGVMLEDKIRRMDESHPDEYKRLSFGYDRDRPFNPDDEVFYLHTRETSPELRLTPDEWDSLRKRGLL